MPADGSCVGGSGSGLRVAGSGFGVYFWTLGGPREALLLMSKVPLYRLWQTAVAARVGRRARGVHAAQHALARAVHLVDSSGFRVEGLGFRV